MRVVLLAALLPLAACGVADVKQTALSPEAKQAAVKTEIVPKYLVGVYR